MEIKSATISRKASITHLVLHSRCGELELNLSDDNPQEIKDVFNSLIKDLKKGSIQFALQDESKDLYHSICEEYIVQLNSELRTVYSELKDYGLTEPELEDLSSSETS
jgi:hypothetical protein